jgi:hypothetical protein
VQSGGARCPELFTSNAKRLGLYEECGGNLNQLIAAKPRPTKKAHYCGDTQAIVDQGRRRRRLSAHSASIQDQVDEIFAYHEDRPAPLASVQSDSRRILQAPEPEPAGSGVPTLNPSPNAKNCTDAYQRAFSSTVPPGVCSGATCTMPCQKLITGMLKTCKDQTFSSHDSVHNIDVEYSFNQQAADAVKMLGPPDCAYKNGYAECGEICDPVQIEKLLNANSSDPSANGNCADFHLGVNFYKWNGCTTKDGNQHNANHRKQCWGRYINVVNKCSGCQNPFVEKLLADVTKAVAAKDCLLCSDSQDVSDKVHQLCCAGVDGILGNGDDPCSEHVECVDTVPVDCENPIKRTGVATCPGEKMEQSTQTHTLQVHIDALH